MCVEGKQGDYKVGWQGHLSIPGRTIQQLLGGQLFWMSLYVQITQLVTLHRDLLFGVKITFFFIRMNLNVSYPAAFPEASKNARVPEEFIFIWYGMQAITAALKRRGCI